VDIPFGGNSRLTRPATTVVVRFGEPKERLRPCLGPPSYAALILRADCSTTLKVKISGGFNAGDHFLLFSSIDPIKPQIQVDVLFVAAAVLQKCLTPRLREVATSSHIPFTFTIT